MPRDFDDSYIQDDILRTLHGADQRLNGPECWWQNGYYPVGNRTWCLWQALLPETSEAIEAATRYLARMIRPWTWWIAGADKTVFDFNDHPDTTFHTMKALLGRAIEKRTAEVMEKTHAI